MLFRSSFLADGRIACVFTRAAMDSLELLDPSRGELERIDLPYTSYQSPSLRSHGNRLVFAAASPTEPASVLTLDVVSGKHEVLRRSTALELDERYISIGEPVDFEGADGLTSHAFYYPPRNPDFEAPEGELPPALVMVHGGPTAHEANSLELQVQLFTSREIGRAHV